MFSVIFHLRRWVATTVLAGAMGGALPSSRLHREVSVLQRAFCTKYWKSKVLTTQTSFFYIYYCCHLLYVLVCIYIHVYLYVNVHVCTHTHTFIECIKMLHMGLYAWLLHVSYKNKDSLPYNVNHCHVQENWQWFLRYYHSYSPWPCHDIDICMCVCVCVFHQSSIHSRNICHLYNVPLLCH